MVYLDAIWLLNLCIDASLMLLTSIIIKRKIQLIRLFLSALIGSSIVLFMLTPYFSVVSHPLSKLLFSIIMVLVAFGFKRFRYFIQSLLTFYFSTFILGGGLIGVHFFLSSDIALLNGLISTNSSGAGSPISWLFVFIGFPILWYFSRARLEDIELNHLIHDQIVEVTICIDDQTLSLKGLIDSGNQLYDPITKYPVMILDVNSAKRFLPPEILGKSVGLDALTQNSVYHPWESRLRIVPYRGVGQENEFLVAIKPDLVSILQRNELIKVKKVLIGLSNSTLSTDGKFNCIIHPKMLLQSSIQSA